jgi:prevent-host-death family protein
VAVTATSLRSILHTVLSRVGYGREHVMLTRQGQPVAVLISPADYDHYRTLEDYLDGFLADQALKEHEASGDKTVPFDDLCRELAL